MENRKLLVLVTCGQCKELNDNNKIIKGNMNPINNLYFNPNTLSKLQEYECPKCGQRVDVLIEPEKLNV